MEKLCANCIYGTKPQSSKSVGKTQQKMQLALEECTAGARALQSVPRPRLVTKKCYIHSHDDDDDDDNGGGKWKCQENVRQLIKKLVAAV